MIEVWFKLPAPTTLADVDNSTNCDASDEIPNCRCKIDHAKWIFLSSRWKSIKHCTRSMSFLAVSGRNVLQRFRCIVADSASRRLVDASTTFFSIELTRACAPHTELQ